MPKNTSKNSPKKPKIEKKPIGSDEHKNALAQSVKIREKWFASGNESTSPVTSNTNKRFVLHKGKLTELT